MAVAGIALAPRAWAVSAAAVALPATLTAADVLVTDAPRLAVLAPQLAFGPAVLGVPGTTLRQLHDQSPLWRDVQAVVATDVALVRQGDKTAGVGMRFGHRMFDVRWLQSPDATLDLIGVALRMDRRPFTPRQCGELRAIYRLAYTTGHAASRLPMTINVVRSLPGDCASFARRGPHGVAAVLDQWAKLPLKAVELNVQTVRWPSTVRPDLGGHAEYALRVLVPRDGHLVPGPMENQPDVARIAADPVLRALLLAWLRLPATPRAIDDGLAQSPQALWATAAVSYAPRGMMRAPNRPWQQLLSDTDVLALGGGDKVLGATRLRRLDQQSCTGCHHSKSVAGFHLPGATLGGGGLVTGRLAVAMSPHVAADMPRRQAYVLALAMGTTPTDARLPPEAPREPGQAQHGEHCGLALEKGWHCAPGLQCTQVDDPEVGVCLPPQPAIGDPCAPGLVRAGKRPGNESVPVTAALDCGAGYCESSRVGFPAGLCAAQCSVAAGAAFPCAGIPGIGPFNACLARGEPFDKCAVTALRPARLRACDAQRPCRDDYACMAASATVAVCMPPYFLQELRMDGHPAPR